MRRIRRALLPPVLLSVVAACDNVGRAFDREVGGSDPTPTPGESVIQVIPEGGDVRDGRPKVRSSFPNGGGWPSTVPIVIEFTESINESSIVPSTPTGTDGRIVLRVSGSTQALPCQYDFVANGRVLVMRPITELSNAQLPTYEVVMLSGGRDVDGLRFTVATDGDVLTSFQVNQDPSIKDGRILTVYPRDNSRDAARETSYWVFFDRPANLNTVGQSSFRVRRRGGSDIVGDRDAPLKAVGIDDTRFVRFVPDDPFAASTVHEFLVDDTITFGSDGKLDFRGRTPFATFETIGPAAPAAVALGNGTGPFPSKVNRANIGSVVLTVTTPADGQAGDRIRARIYGGDATTTAAGDNVFIEGSAQVSAAGTQSVAVDFAGRLGTAQSPRFDDGELTVVAQILRGSQQSGFAHNSASNVPSFDVTPPTLVRAGPPASADGMDILVDQEHLAFFGRASEQVAEASLAVDGIATPVNLYASADDGRFLMLPMDLGRSIAPRNFALTLTDLAGNPATAAATGRVIQRGLATGTVAGDLTVEVYDQTTMLPLASTLVVVDPGTPTAPATAQITGTTAANGRVVFTGLTAPRHTITVVRGGYQLTTVYATAAAFVSMPLRPREKATSTLGGTVVFTQAPGTTAMVGCSSFDDTTALDVRTTNAAPTSIPSTPLVPNRPVVLSAFGGVFEPTQPPTVQPTFAFQGIGLLGPTLTELAPPLAPAAGGAVTTAALPMIPSLGPLLAALLTTYNVDFSLATGLDTANLLGGVPTVRVLARLQGFGGQLLTGVGLATLGAGASYTVNANFSFPAFTTPAFVPFIADGSGLLATTARDQAGRISRHRAFLLPVTGTPVNTFTPPAIPTITVPVTPSTGSPAVTYDDVYDAALGGVLMEVTAEDTAGRTWNILLQDSDGSGSTDSVQFPDLSAVGAAGLATGTWTVRVEGRLITNTSLDDMMFADRVRNEVLYSRSLSVPFTVQ